MRLFTCDACKNTIHFDTIPVSIASGASLRTGRAGDDSDRAIWRRLVFGRCRRSFALCANADSGACNWLVPIEQAGGYCLACQHNRVVPDLSSDLARSAFSRMLTAAHHLFYSLDAWRLPAPTKDEDAMAALHSTFLPTSRAPQARPAR